MSTLTYAVQVYGGCSDYLLRALQTLQNSAARHVTKLPWLTPTKDLLLQCGWFSVKQLIVYHSLLLLHRVQQERSPKHIFSKLSSPKRTTRVARKGTLLDKRWFKTATALKTFVPRSIEYWNNLPDNLRCIDDKKQFKILLTMHVKENIQLR